ncbi:reverse transcriptase-like protein [Patescibacteria group bacterium]|nr:MAG: reverse transcriptase-like protein [Patescibacteria group bacterium]
MKQKVTTKAVIQHDNKILLLRRKGGRPSIRGLYELPGGRVHMNQQPEDAVQHALRIHAGVAVEHVHLKDVLSFLDPDDRELQYVLVVYEATLKPTDRTIELSEEYDKYVWKRMGDIQQNKLTQSTLQVLGLQDVPFGTSTPQKIETQNDDSNTSISRADIFTDGGSRGNPGPSASGFVVLNERSEIISEGGAYLGITTNDVAEYQAVYLGLVRAQEIGVRIVSFKLDSQLVANQMNGIYDIKSPDLAIISNRIKELMKKFDKVTFTHVRREYNTLADGVVNKILDSREQQNNTG